MNLESDGEAANEDVLSELAKRRRAEVEADSSADVPSVIQLVESSEVVYTMEPAALPFNQADVEELNETLWNLYHLSPAPIDWSPLASTIPREQLSSMSGEELMRRLMRSRDSVLQWNEGRFPTRTDYVEISSVRCNFESIVVRVKGRSQVAELIAQEILEAWWSAAGGKKTFKDIESDVVLKGYATSTRVKLLQPFESLVDTSIMSYLSANIATGEHFASKMGRLPVGSNNRSIIGGVFLDDLIFQVATYNPENGTSAKHELALRVRRTSDYGKGIISVSSGLPYNEHANLISGLFGGKAEVGSQG